MRLTATSWLGILLLSVLPYIAFAKGVSCKEGEVDCVRVGSWSASIAVGAGLRENPVVGREDIPLFLLPSVSYHGHRFSLENFNVSYLLAENQHHSLHFVSFPSLEYMFFNDWSLGNVSLDEGGGTSVVSEGSPTDEFADAPSQGNSLEPPENDAPSEPVSIDDLHDRNLVYLSGLEYGIYSGPMYIGFQALQDVSSVHKGQELRFAVSYDKQFHRHRFSATTGVLWKSTDAMDYYYGIRSSEVDDQQLEYQAGSGASYFVKLRWNKRLSEHWSLSGSAYYRRLSAEASHSPLTDKEGIATVFFGGVYHF